MEEVIIENIEILTPEEKELAEKILGEYHKKIKRLIKDSPKLKVHIKEYKTDGKGKKFSLNTELSFSGKKLKSESVDWDLTRALHKAMIKLQTELEHKLHVSEKY
jgi:ribosome-associated translation inhibitor RaiA